MSDLRNFARERLRNIRKLGSDKKLRQLALKFLAQSSKYKYSYNFDWLGLPIIQFPQDIMAMQEIIWKVKPDLIIETGVARGGSIIFYASLLEMLGGKGKVVGIDIDIRQHNKKRIMSHPLYKSKKRIILLEGSSTDSRVLEKVRKIARGKKRILICLDSDHTHDHVIKELELYSPLVSKGSYIVVFDTDIEQLPASLFVGKPYSKGNSPQIAADVFLAKNNNFIADKQITDKFLITVATGGYLKRIM